jgi:hypothetical protein
MPYFTPAKGLLDIPALWGHKLKPNMPLLDRPRIIPREPIQVIWVAFPLDAMWFWDTHTTITPKRRQIRDKVLTFRFCLTAYRYVLRTGAMSQCGYATCTAAVQPADSLTLPTPVMRAFRLPPHFTVRRLSVLLRYWFTELTNSTCVKCRGVVSAFGRPMVFTFILSLNRTSSNLRLN